MKPKDIIIATAVILIISSLLSGCKSNTTAKEQAKAAAVQQIVTKAAQAKKEVSLFLESKKEKDKVTVTITLKNPHQKPITSVQSWLSFDTAKLKGDEIDVSKSDFSLPAPYNNAFDNQNGLMMLGRSNPIAVTDQKIDIAVVTFKVKDSKSVTIDAYDYRDDLTGHTSANTLIDGKPYNILVKPESPLLIINK